MLKSLKRIHSRMTICLFDPIYWDLQKEQIRMWWNHPTCWEFRKRIHSRWSQFSWATERKLPTPSIMDGDHLCPACEFVDRDKTCILSLNQKFDKVVQCHEFSELADQDVGPEDLARPN